MKIGILGAMHEEIALIKKLLVISKETEMGGRIYYEGMLGNNEVILTFSRWGKVASSSTVTTLINQFEVNFVIFMGVAGAVKESLNIGDVVIADSLYQHDMDARPLFNQFQIPLTDKIFFEPALADKHKAKDAVENFFANMTNTISPELLKKYAINQPVVKIGTVASGDKFITEPVKQENLTLKHYNKETLAVEMEGAAVAQVCSEYNIPFIIIRTISDKADHNATLDFQAFISDIASHYSAGIIKSLFRI